MRLLCVHADTVDALRRLHIPFDDITPDGLWASTYHLLAVSPEQRDVLLAWGVQFEELTPVMLERALLGGARETTREPARAASAPAARRDRSRGAPTVGSISPAGIGAPASPAPSDVEVPVARRADRAGSARADEHAIVQEAIARNGTREETAAAAPAAAAPAPAPATDDQSEAAGREGTRLRISVAGSYREGTVADGKILVDGKRYDSPAQATTGLTNGKGGEWSFWEYFDSADGKWRMLDREWDAFLNQSPERSGR